MFLPHLPPSWYRGYNHYHTSFRFPTKYRVSPDRLIDGMRELGVRFVFCAGDHADGIDGRGDYWGFGEDYPAYMEYCLSNSIFDVILIPSIEHHLHYPDRPDRDNDKEIPQHHVCIPSLGYFPEVYSHDSNVFILKAHEHNLAVSLNHPYLSTTWNWPDPLTLPALYEFDYIELVTGDWPNYFVNDLEIYLNFLRNTASARMGCCAGVDNALRAWIEPKDEPGNLNSTYLYVSGELNNTTLMEAWEERRAYAVHGHLYLENIDPIPAKSYIHGVEKPRIRFTVKNSANKPIQRTEIYNNGVKVYQDKGEERPTHSVSFEDGEVCGETAHYIIPCSDRKRPSRYLSHQLLVPLRPYLKSPEFYFTATQ